MSFGFLSGPIGMALSISVGLVSIAVAVWIAWRQRQLKELAVGVLHEAEVVAVAPQVARRVTVWWDNKPVKNLHVVRLALKNSGHKAISREDFIKPLEITFPCGEVMSSHIESQYPVDLGVSLKTEGHGLKLDPLLLNAGDQVVIQVIFSSTEPNVQWSARIKDVAVLEPIELSAPPSELWKSPMFTNIVLLLLLGAVFSVPAGELTSSLSAAFLLGAIAIFLVDLALWVSRRFGTAARRRIVELTSESN